MYSGTTLVPMRYFDAWFGAHQKIDRVARRHLRELLAGRVPFPSTGDILKFEGVNGPDGIKRKSPGQNEPQHFYDPKNPKDHRLLELIDLHYDALVTALRAVDTVRAGFEAAWLAHAIVDGLTPAHQYPYEKELVRLRTRELAEDHALYDRHAVAKEKLLMQGATVSERVRNNWKMWGDKGLLATHFAFEWGIAAMVTPLRLSRGRPSEDQLDALSTDDLKELFVQRADEIAKLDMYNRFYSFGWTPKLARVARRELLPRIVNTVTLAWYSAALASMRKG